MNSGKGNQTEVQHHFYLIAPRVTALPSEHTAAAGWQG